ncbi:MAG: hypothetical protein HY301_14865 [Verrucomicrobia bacterium]|nr:hypothetical protein [Verrucomicrobiota bacterium]
MQSTAERKSKRKTIGAILIFFGVALVFSWVYWLQPLRRTTGLSDWVLEHTDRAIWNEATKRMTRVGWEHDDFALAGHFGDKKWAEWIIKSLRPGENFEDCSTGHRDAALAMIANQYAGPSSDDWINWWKTNAHKSQVEWISDGFKQAGLNLETPLTEENKKQLVLTLGPGRTNEHGAALYPGLRWNAFLLLRKEAFSTRTFLATALGSTNSEELVKGLLLYENLYSTHWKDFHEKSFSDEFPIHARWIPVVLFAVAGLSLGAGLLLFGGKASLEDAPKTS